MPLPFSELEDVQLFKATDAVIVGYLLLMFLPFWKHTSTITFWMAAAYSLMSVLVLQLGPDAITFIRRGLLVSTIPPSDHTKICLP